MMTEKKQPTSPTSETKSRSILSAFIMLGGAACLGIVLAVGVSVAEVLRQIDTRSIYLGLDGLRRPIAVALALLLASLGLIVWRRPRFQTVAKLAGVAVLLVIGCCSLFRIESFYGNMVPRLTWRWTPPVEDQLDDFLSTQLVATYDPVDESAFTTTDTDFPGFLGPQRNGHLNHVALSDNWDDRPPLELWRHPVGLGWSSFAAVGKVAVTLEQRGELESTVCYDLETGHEIWVHGDELRFEDEHGDGPRTTPAISDGRVYSLGATGLLNCLDLKDGRLIWQQQVLVEPDKNNLLWGMSGSPLVAGDLVVVSPGGGSGRSLIAYDRHDGTLAWNGGDDPAAYASPLTLTINNTPQFVIFNGAGLRGFDDHGQPLWLFPWITQGEKQRVNVAQPVQVTPPGSAPDKTYFLVSSGYSMGMSLVEVSQDGDAWQVSEVWHSTQLKSKMSNFVVVDGYIYGFDNGIFTCLELETGKRMWKRGRYGHGQVLTADGKLLVQAETGEVVLLKATPEGPTELGTLAALNGKTWNHATLAGHRLVVRNDREAACFELP